MVSKASIHVMQSCQSRCPSLLNVWLGSQSYQQFLSNRLVSLRTNNLRTLMSPRGTVNCARPFSYGKWNYATSNVGEKRRITRSNIDQKSGSDDGLAYKVEDPSASESLVNMEKPGILQRFREAYKQYGKILVCVHVVTSAVWISSFYYAAVSGIDIVTLLQWIGASEKVIFPFKTPGVGDAAVTFLMFKLASPVRYAVTIGGTHLIVRYLRRLGYLPPITANQRIRSLVKEKYDDLKAQRSKEHKL